MGAWKVIEEVVPIVEEHLGPKIAEVGAEELATLVTDFEVFKRQRAETIWKRSKAAVGIWAATSSTRAVEQTRRRWKVALTFDYTFQDQDIDDAAQQIGLTARAMMRVIDLLPTTSGLLIDAASEDRGSAAVVEDLDDLLQEAAGDVSQGGPVVGGFRITIPITLHENVP